MAQYGELFPLMTSCRSWDLPDGDAELMAGISDNCYDFVHSSHCLEHMRNVSNAFENWVRILKPGGHLVCLVPDEDLYEQGVFPSSFNGDHKHTFTIFKKKSWSNHSVNVFDLLAGVRQPVEIKKVELLDATYRYGMNAKYGYSRIDQTCTPIGESAIEIIIKKIV